MLYIELVSIDFVSASQLCFYVVVNILSPQSESFIWLSITAILSLIYFVIVNALEKMQMI